MSRNKQIEEMAKKIICPCLYGDNDCESCDLYEDRRCLPFDIAKEIDNREYRKSTVLAEEIFAEIDKLLRQHRIEFDMSCVDFYFEKHYAELKKKYIGKDINVPNNTEDN